MPTAYTTNLRLALPATGELAGTWGTTVNTAITALVEQAIAGVGAISMTDANYTLTTANGASDQARNAILSVTSSVPLTATRTVTVPNVSKVYIVNNATTGGQSIVISTGAGTTQTVPNATTAYVYVDGSANVVSALSYHVGVGAFTTLATSQNVTMNTPSAGVTLTVNPVFGAVGIDVPATGFDAIIRAESTTSGNARLDLYVNGNQSWAIKGNRAGNSLDFGQSVTANMLSIGGSGNVTVNAPSSGVALSVTGFAGQNVASFLGNQTSSFAMAMSNTNAAGGSQLVLYANNTALQGFVEMNTAGAFNVGVAGNNSVNTYTNGSVRTQVNGAGNFTLNAPTSGNSLSITSQGNNYLLALGSTGNATNGVGHLNFDTSGNLYLYADTASATLFTGSSAGGLAWVSNGINRGGLSPAGNFTINAPTSGVALTVNGFAGSDIADFTLNQNGISNFVVSNSNAGTSAASQIIASSNAGQAYLTMNSLLNAGTAGAAFLGYSGATAMYISATNASGAINFQTGGFNTRGSISSAGMWSLNAPTSANTTLVVNGYGSGGSTSMQILAAGGAAGTGFALDIAGNSNTNNPSYLRMLNNAYSLVNFQIYSDNTLAQLGSIAGISLAIQAGGATKITVNPSGACVVVSTPPAAASALVVNGGAQTPPITPTFGATTTVDVSRSNVFRFTATSNFTLAVSNVNDGQTINVYILQDATGNRVATWPAAFKWPGGAAGLLSTAANAVDLLVASYDSTRAVWYCALSKAFA